ncbi:iron-sulfur cluster biosynthesis family protein [Radiobacillus deserti]|uniref:Iron-sulfur cluster biosynthesis family protein n=1 Tax=Radiobacillus deserti TaxID=2594883 RepID=A0A516KGK8_9BACI|nr:iron-sulfur cluster biosynthesis family protein [Radiobacillus deserti]
MPLIQKRLTAVTCKEFPVFVHPKDSVFLEQDMTLDYNNQRFRLNSPSGMLNGFIPKNSLFMEVQI